MKSEKGIKMQNQALMEQAIERIKDAIGFEWFKLAPINRDEFIRKIHE